MAVTKSDIREAVPFDKYATCEKYISSTPLLYALELLIANVASEMLCDQILFRLMDQDSQ